MYALLRVSPSSAFVGDGLIFETLLDERCVGARVSAVRAAAHEGNIVTMSWLPRRQLLHAHEQHVAALMRILAVSLRAAVATHARRAAHQVRATACGAAVSRPRPWSRRG